ncbi:serine/threonine protein phosphatase (plasmid) [Azospirillum oryzae]|uniref:Serine/threonine protein phosphatase n=1 Tax=Azospirillum oryzae TaxID=286727 RepID=A0A6N1AQZ7_9PROT|nr:metallophosphoesterase family protein [Azospirillum oryzae]KAA0586925.1 serine/threonine protein phosphatase [Azospirillum oryzae]QKS54211.1 serine/threonine protein phosphatase [Azospirillum oryzae]
MLSLARKLWAEAISGAPSAGPFGGRAGPASVPRGMRVYAVGDIHGRLDLLDQMLGQIVRDAEQAPNLLKYLVFLGDYVDRGPDSRLVIERLACGLPPAFGAVFLRGNHEDTMLGFLSDLRVAPGWLTYGGDTTLESYGIPAPDPDAPMEHLQQAQMMLNSLLPAHHRAFLTGLRCHLTIGDYHFVHAGVRPGVPLDRQEDQDRLWIREAFLVSRADHGKVVVHGHTIAPEPELLSNRIGIDTGAYATNRLTALVLEGTDRRFLCTV